MPVIGITGGIATGKSTFARNLARRLPAEVFDADRAAHELLDGEPAVWQAILEAFGSAVCDANGRPDRTRLRELVFSGEVPRRRLEDILHPSIRARWLARSAECIKRGGWLLVDLPLLYETGAESHFESIVAVACSPEIQRRRLHSERGLDSALAEKIIAAQLDLQTKCQRSDHVVWTDFASPVLDWQTELLSATLHSRYG